MTKFVAHALLGAVIALAATRPAEAEVLFANDFSTGIGYQEDLIGNFTTADGYLGHHNGYANNEYSSYRIVLDVAGVSNAFLDYDYWINSQNILDGVQVLANDTTLGGYTGNGAGHARFALDALTRPDVIGRSTIAFDFLSDFAVTAGGFQIDNLVITGDRAVVPTSDVPEPATWAMMVMGFGLLGAAMRARRNGSEADIKNSLYQG